MAVHPHTDPNVKVPAAVKASSARAERIHKEVYSKPEDEAPKAPVEGAEEKEGATPPPAAPTAEPVVPAPQDTPAAAPAAPAAHAAPAAPAAPSDAEWEHRYNSMRGRYDRSQEQVQGLASRISQLEGVIASLQAAPVEKPSEPAPEVLITPEEVSDYGADFLSVVGKKAQQVVGPEVTQLRRQISELEKKLTSVNGHFAQDAQARMHADLEQKCPDWKTINNDKNFLAWLQLPDTYSGAIRHELLKAAYERNDTPRVLAFFNGFLAEEAAVAPATAGAEPAAAAYAPGKVPLADLAAPGRAKSPAASPAPAEKPIINRAQIAQFYADVAAGKYRGKDVEKDRFEKLIFEAQAGGRIR